MGKYSNRYKTSGIDCKTGFMPDDTYDWDDIPSLAKDKWVANWDLPYAKKHRVRCDSKSWKHNSKSRHQWRYIPHFDLYSEFEQDECGFLMTEEQMAQYEYLFSHYDYRLFVA